MRFSCLFGSATIFAVFVAVAAAQPGPTVEYLGMCDASAATSIHAHKFIVANDEDNVLRIYQRNQPSSLQNIDLTAFLNINLDHPEADIEGVTRLGQHLFWITSHGRNKEGKLRPNRHRLFATDIAIEGDKVTIVPIGQPYLKLLEQLTAAPNLVQYELGKAERAPEASGGLNIEGLTATPEGTLLIGFRNPIPDGKALLVAIENPEETIRGQAAKLGDVIELQLDGLGVRSIEYSVVRGGYLIVAGPAGDQGSFKLYQWSGRKADTPRVVAKAVFNGFHPEAMFLYPDEPSIIQLLSDDGDRKLDGSKCKDAELNEMKFRAISIDIR